MQIDNLLSRLKGVKRLGDGKWLGLCPAHDDHSPSLSVKEADGRILIHCHAGCSTAEVVKALGLTLQDLMPSNVSPLYSSVNGCKLQTSPGITLEELAEAKHLPPEFLASLGWKTARRRGKPAVRIPYRNEAGDVCTIKYRVAQTGHRFEYRRGDKAMLYGLDRLADMKKAGWCLLVEGESDSATAWYFDIPCIGVPGKDIWKPEWAAHFEGVVCYNWQEPEAASFSEKLGASLPGLKVIVSPEGIKDISEAHILGHDLVALLEKLRAEAIPFSSILQERRAAVAQDLRVKAAPVLAESDPLALVKAAIRDLGYGGDVGPALVVYLAATSRLLAMRRGSMPVHLLLVGPPSTGKSYTLAIVLELLPPEAYHTIDAASPKVLIYDKAELRHKLLIFSEADSLPAGEDNPAASAIRNLLQDHRLHYQVTLPDAQTGAFTNAEIDKPGPTAMVTTALRRLGAQLDSRLFSLEVPDGQDQVRSALAMQAHIELSGAVEPSEGLVAFQGYLQALAPWKVVVPFADKLAAAIAASPVSARASRDFARLLSFIKAVAILRHQHRQRDATGRLVADIEDYAAVYGLVVDIYAASATGASERVRETVKAVESLLAEGREKVAAVQSLLAEGKGHVTVTEVAGKLGVHTSAASRRVAAAIRGRWLVNSEARKHAPANLTIGEPLPARAGLPSPEELSDGDANPSSFKREDVCSLHGLTDVKSEEVLV